jgi:hypothetical protein
VSISEFHIFAKVSGRNRSCPVSSRRRAVQAGRFRGRVRLRFRGRPGARRLDEASLARARRARPMFHRTRDAIEAHLTLVFTALAVSREVQARTGLAIRNVIRQLRPLRSATLAINGTTQTYAPAIPADQQAILDALHGPKLTH